MSINKDSKKAPNLRFKGFTDDWEQRKLGEIADVKDSARISNELWVENGIPYLRSSDLVNGELNGELFISNDTYEKYASKTGAPQKDDVLFTSGGKVGIVYHKMDDSPVYVQGGAVLYVKTSISVLLEGSFLSVYFSSPKMQLYLDIASSGGTIKHFTLKPANSSPIVFPSISEQSKIGQFFKTLDDTITLHQRKLDQLIQLKEALLQQMFPGKGETVPKLRFAGFEGDWEERKLGELGETKSGIGFPDDEQGGKKGIPFFKVSDMNNIGNEHELKNSNNYVDTEQLKRRNWKPIMNVPAVIFAKVGAAIMLNRKRIVRMPFLLDNNTMAYIFDDSWNSDFGKILFETIYLPRYAQVGALPSYNGSDINSIKVFIPNKKEQEKIGVFFKQLDNTITLQQRKLEQLQNMKQVLLQNMFI